MKNQLGFLALLICVSLWTCTLLAQESPEAVCQDLVSRIENPATRKAAMLEVKSQKEKLLGWAAKEKDSILVQYAAGTSCILNDAPKNAIQYMARAFELSGQHPSVATHYALALKMSLQPLKAVEVLEQTVESNPEIPQMKIVLGVHYLGVQKYKRARSVLQDFVKPLTPSVPERMRKDMAAVRMQYGIALLYLGEHKAAIKTLEEANALWPNAAGILLPLGEAYLKNGEKEKAKVSLEAALEINEKVPGTLYWLGVANEKDTPDQAKQYFEKAWEFGVPRYANADLGGDLFLMHQIALKLGNQEKADEYKKNAKALGFTFEAPWADKQ